MASFRVEEPAPDADALNPSPPLRYQVFNASHVLVASYSTQGGAEGHIASWPALYYTDSGPPAQAPTLGEFGAGSPLGRRTRTKSDG